MNRNDTAVCVTAWKNCNPGTCCPGQSYKEVGMGFEKILDYIYPPRCPVCDRISQTGICSSCKKKLLRIDRDYCLKCGKPLTDSRKEYCPDCRRHHHVFDRNRALFSYQGPLRISVYQIKYGNRRDFARVYGQEIAVTFSQWIRQRNITQIIPIPLHPSRYRERGYNQAAVIAREIGKNLGIPVKQHVLRRVKKTQPQKLLAGNYRNENLRQAFALYPKAFPGENVLLVDDIYTTGATLDAAAACLKKAGAKHVYGVTVAIGG